MLVFIKLLWFERSTVITSTQILPQITDLKKKQENQALHLRAKQRADEAAKRLQEDIHRIKTQKVHHLNSQSRRIEVVVLNTTTGWIEGRGYL